MSGSDRIAVMSDVHGEFRVLERVLERCHAAEVHCIVLLGDLFDRCDQIEPCLQRLSGWPIAGVIGNHERDALKNTSMHGTATGEQANTLIHNLGDRLLLGNTLFIHDVLEWKSNRDQSEWSPHLVFAGHTHVRQAQDQHGPLDLSLGHIKLRNDRSYLINPGAVVDGQFAIWNREESTVIFERI